MTDVRHRLGTAALLPVALGTLAAGGLVAATAQAQTPPSVPLGQIAPFSGSGAEFGEYYEDAAQLAVDQVNAATSEVMGGPVISELIAEDTNTLPNPGVEAARKLVEADGVPAIVGGWSSGVAVAVATSVTIPSEVLQVANGATSPLLSALPEDQEADMLFRTTASDLLQGVVAAQLARGEIFEDYSVDSAATIYVNNPYGQGLSNAFAAAFERRGGTIHGEVPHPEETQPTYTSQLDEALGDDPDMLFASSYPAHTATFLREARDIFDIDTIQFVDGNRSQQVIESMGADYLEGFYGTAPAANPDSAGYSSFAAAYREATGRENIPPFTDSAYDAAMAISLAVVKAIADGHDAEEITGTVLRDRLREVSNPPGQQILASDMDSLRAGIEAIMNGEDVDYSGAAGPVDFDENGDVITPMSVWQFTDGGIETVRIIEAENIPRE
ncbi:ABC transporter substrate-binding protein [Spiribacter halobius]|uniref:Amino acid ABC transporter substrate-binding protein n=1 Tax=Sediminicurvatus halobius TaxID=2182432 RepID=A0A2U2N5U8_9GAMM|nr:ABC transporter substrate-binding protein [Spiribacter halobius]PWG64591.1 amino acid ABC transporter substrate-binding protein [Spiribacter halobius]UEX79087.1 ABC transporter substrate-binding protein [Spiribacter halobius]